MIRYYFKTDKDYKSLLDGRPIKHIANKIDYNRGFLSEVLRGKRGVHYYRAQSIIDGCGSDKDVEYYFTKAKKGS